jgi:hypothetical protein
VVAVTSAASRIAGTLITGGVLLASTAAAAWFDLPTENRALFESGGEARFFAPTPGRSWTAGQFGCVRSEGSQLHEGIDILALRRDREGEPLDDVRSVAGGEVAYINRHAGLSNYGVYVVVRHWIERLEVFTLYAHLREARDDLKAGSLLERGERLGRMGRTANTATPIGKDRAHVHFEIALLANDRFSEWLPKTSPTGRNDHGPWNGRNLLGLDAAEILRADHQSPGFSLLTYVRTQREMCRILVCRTDFPWLRRYPMLIRRNPKAEREGIVAYEVSLNFNGVPFRLVPRGRSELKGEPATRLLSVNEVEHRNHPCRKLVFKRGQRWSLTAQGKELIDLLTY